jgi:hypothetical protein
MRVPLFATFILLAVVSAAKGETSSQLAATKPAEAYSYFKRALARVRAGSEEAKLSKEDTFVPLTSCNDATDFIGYDGKQNSILEKTAQLAYDVLYLEAALKVAGYPESVWRPQLTEYERSNLAAIREFKMIITDKGSPAKQRLARKLNDYKKKSGGHYKDIIPQAEGCGAGEVDVKIRTIPSALRIEYINVIKYDLAALKGSIRREKTVIFGRITVRPGEPAFKCLKSIRYEFGGQMGQQFSAI